MVRYKENGGKNWEERWKQKIWLGNENKKDQNKQTRTECPFFTFLKFSGQLKSQLCKDYMFNASFYVFEVQQYFFFWSMTTVKIIF